MPAFHTTFFWIFLCFFTLHECVELVLELCNFRHVKRQKEVPDFYQHSISPSLFEKSKTYTLEKIKFSIAAQLTQIPFFLFLIFRNGFNALDYYAAQYAGYGTLSHSVLFCIFLAIYFGIVGLPFKIYSIFVIEEKYGFNQMSFSLFVIDLIKSIFLALLFGIPLLFLIFWFMNITGIYWWISVWGALMMFQLFMAAIYPALIAPMFNKFKPLPESQLKEQILELAKKIRFKISGVFIIDGSRRSLHSNAYFAGLGRFRRIVLFDTLVKKLSTDELLSVLAHEMGHNIKKHMIKSLALSSVFSLIGLYVLSLLINWPEFYQSFNVTVHSHHAALVVFALSSEAFTFMLTPLLNYISRRHEYEADKFSVEVLSDKEALKNSLTKLAKENLSNLTPHTAYSFYHYSHPTTLERAKAIDEL